MHKYTIMAKGRNGVKIKSMIDLILVKRDILCKVRLVGAWIMRREVVIKAGRIKSEKLRKHRYREGYTRSLEGKELE